MVAVVGQFTQGEQMRSSPFFVKSVLCTAISGLLIPAPALSEPMQLSMTPANSSYKPAAPNVIVSVDDSGSMGDNGITALKNALYATFTSANVPDGSIRLSWQSMTGCPGIPSCGNRNTMKNLDATHRQDFMNWVGRLAPIGSTPSHRMLYIAGEYLKAPLDQNSPWAAKPGETLQPVLACRKAYNLFMTDGGWNQLDMPRAFVDQDSDGTTTALPDGTTYDVSDDSTTIYRGLHSGNPAANLRFNPFPFLATSFSDLAFRYWATDLQPDIENKVKPSIVKAGTESFANAGVKRDIPEYWNPRNDPATWQHLNLYTVGFNAAAAWTIDPKFGSSTWTGGDYDALMTGTAQWPNPIEAGTGVAMETIRMTELWHSALNTRGRFIPAPNADSLKTAFKDVLADILADRSTPVASLAASAQTTRLDSGVYAASYSAAGWSGAVTGYKIKANGTALETTGLWGDVPAVPAVGTQPAKPARPLSTADLLDAQPATWPANRVVLSSVTDRSTGSTLGTSWEWEKLSTAQADGLKTLGGVLDTSTAATPIARARLAYLRGDRSKEPSDASPIQFRQRDSRQGDIVNSKLWYLSGQPSSAYAIENYAGFRAAKVARPAMVYVGANDGMLHGFDAATGAEKIAYVPDGLHAKLADLTDPAYRHAYYVDGSPFTGDVYLGTLNSKEASHWRTYLAGFPGAGGKGYFVLDVTDPSAFSAANASSLVVADKTAAMDDDVGHILSDPVTEAGDPSISRQITRMNDGRWALVMGNGYNSRSEKAVLLIQYLDGDKELRKITTDRVGANGNGLSAPRLIDLNGDLTPDIAYAGDLRGNMWKFNLASPDSSEWKVASETPFFVARNGSGASQAITGAPVWKPHSKGGVMLAFATGRNLTDADRSTRDAQTIYGVHDATPVSLDDKKTTTTGAKVVILGAADTVSEGRSALVEQTVSGSTTAQTDGGNPLWTTSANPVPYEGGTAKKGWFLDLPVAGERVLQNLAWFKGDLIDVSSTIPALGGSLKEETCDPPDARVDHYRTTINIENGARPISQIYGYAAGHVDDGVQEGRIKQALGIELERIKSNGKPEITCQAAPGTPACSGRQPPVMRTARPSWRQIQ